MVVLLSLDGLSLDDLVQLMQFLPQSQKVFKSLGKHFIEGIHSEAHPIWGELLTGSVWFDNGCYGYAAVGDSVNKLKVFDERQLMRTVWLEHHQAASVAINLPILLPNKANRVWLADGSLPINRIISPSHLRTQEPFASYVPRAYNSQRVAQGSRVRLAQECIDVEEQRLACAVELFRQEGWSNFVYRLSLFDQLFHLFGHQGFNNGRLGFSKNLRAFLEKFDSALSSVFAVKPETGFALISAYSHVPCRGMINLNELFLQMGLLSKQRSETSYQRALVMESTGMKQSSHNFTSYDGCIDDSSIASSPISGTVFLNRKSMVQETKDTQADQASLRTRIQSELVKVLENSAPQFENNPNLNNACFLPDFIVKLDGVGYHNMVQEEVTSSDFPLSVHSSKGFALLSPDIELSETASPATLGRMLASREAL